MKDSHAIVKFSPVRRTAYFLMLLMAISACSDESNKKVTSGKVSHQSASFMSISPDQNYIVERDYLGQITAKQHTNLSFEYTGKVNKVIVDNGDVVKKGQVLAQQDTQLLSYKTSELQANIVQSQAQITLNKANLNRIKVLINDGYSSKQSLDELNAENQILNAQIDGLHARIKTLVYQREKSVLIAPFDGVITQRLISNGEVVAASKVSFRIIESANNEVSVGIPSKVASTLTLGQLIQIKVGIQNKQGKLIAIGHQIDPANRTVLLRLKMLEKQDKAKEFNGQLVRITIEEQINKAGFWLPINAITDGVRGQWQVFIAVNPSHSKDNYQLQAVTVNILHANEHSVYVNGLSLKEHNIVSQGVHRYVTGQTVIASSQELANAEGVH